MHQQRAIGGFFGRAGTGAGVRRCLPALAVALLLGAVAGNAQQGPDPREPTAQATQELFEAWRSARQQANRLLAKGELAEAIALGRRVLEIERQLLGTVHPQVAGTLQWLAVMQEAHRDLAAAETSRREAVAVTTQLYGEDDWRVAEARVGLAQLQALAKLDPAERTRLETARQRMHEGIGLSQQGKPREAFPAIREALQIRKELLGPKHLDYANSLNSLAVLHQATGEYARAEPLYQEALEIHREVLGRGHPKCATQLNNLAALCDATGDYARAEPLYREALEIRRAKLGEKDPSYVLSLNNLAALYDSMGDYRRAEPLYQQALQICREAGGEKHPTYAAALSNLAELYDAMGQYARAEPLCRKALEIRKEVLGEKHPDYAYSVNNLGALYEAMGDQQRARPLYEQAAQIWKEVYGDGHPQYAVGLNNLAGLDRSIRRFDRAEERYRQASKIWEDTFGRDHPAYALSINNLAELYHAMGEYDRAGPLYEQALEIRGRVLGQRHPSYVTSLSNLAALCDSTGDYARSEPLHRQACELGEEVFGPDHPRYAEVLKNYAALHLAMGHHDRAEPLLRQALEITERLVEETFAVLSQRQQMAMVRSLRHTLDGYLSVSADVEQTDAQAYQYLLDWKGAVFIRQQQTRLAAAGPELQPLLAELQSTTSRLARLAYGTCPPEQRDTWQRQLAELSGSKERLEAELARRSRQFRQAPEAVTPQRLRAALPPKTALVDFLEYTHSSPPVEETEGKFRYQQRLLAFVVRADRSVARLDLGPLEPIREAVGTWREGLGVGDKATAAGLELRRRVWQPLATHLADAGAVLISPDGALARFPLAALPGKQRGSYLIEELPLAVVPVPRWLPRLLADEPTGQDPAEPRPPASLLVLGDIDYDAPPGGSTGHLAMARPAGRGEAMQFSEEAVKNSRGEILAVCDSFELAHDEGTVRALRRQKATEEQFRREAPGHRFLHLATHGFFAPPALESVLVPDAQSGLGRLAQGPDRRPGRKLALFHPGLLSGLALAGANRQPQAGEDDGILTAAEVAAMNLHGVELAVLSACETGLGEVAGGEGVLGLQRAFQVSGTRTVVASLWKVPDSATRDLMERFYENLWDRKMDKLEALRQAQLYVLRGGHEKGLVVIEEGEEPDRPSRLPPYYWAAFVLSGDWR